MNTKPTLSAQDSSGAVVFLQILLLFPLHCSSPERTSISTPVTMQNKGIPKTARGLSLLILLATASSIQARDFFQTTPSEEKFLPVDQAFQFASKVTDKTLELHWQVTPGYYLYRGRIKVTPVAASVRLGPPRFSIPGTREQDPYFGEVTVFFKSVSATVPVTLPRNLDRTRIDITYQGCAKAGFCYPPQHRQVLFSAANHPDE